MKREQYICRVTLLGSVVNFLLVLFKFACGIFGRSSAMVADAAHSLSDFGSDLVILLCVRISSKPEDEDHAYGHAKFETLAAVCIGLILLATGLGFFLEAAKTIIAYLDGASLPQPTWLALLAALVSILIKEGLYQYTIRAARNTDSSTLRANAWHHRSDALSSIATLLGVGGAMLPGEKWLILDPLAACLISLFIIGMAFSLMKPGIDELMEKSLPPAERDSIERIILSTPGVLGYHRLRTRRIGVKRAVEAHIKLDGAISLAEAHDTASEIERKIRAALGANTHVGIHMEPAKESGEK